MTTHTPGPWDLHHQSLTFRGGDCDWSLQTEAAGAFLLFCHHPDAPAEANARLIAAAPDLFEAALRLEMAELAHANCEECEGEEIPELCPACFPLFDQARTMRRLALEKARRGSAALASAEPRGDH